MMTGERRSGRTIGLRDFGLLSCAICDHNIQRAACQVMGTEATYLNRYKEENCHKPEEWDDELSGA